MNKLDEDGTNNVNARDKNAGDDPSKLNDVNNIILANLAVKKGGIWMLKRVVSMICSAMPYRAAKFIKLRDPL